VITGMLPHEDAQTIHAPGECGFCDLRPDLQDLRAKWHIAYTPSGQNAAGAQRPTGELRHPRDAGDQPLPTTGSGPAIHGLVVTDILARLELGVRRYGQPLRAHNGRDSLRDAYEECLDLACYLRQLIEETTTTSGS
jgi:hypothetical protein